MPKPSYLQTIARRANSDLPVLMPPRSVLPSRRESSLSQVDGPLLPDPADELVPARLPNPGNETVRSSQQPLLVAPLQETALPPRSSLDRAPSPPLSVPSRVELPDEIKATPVWSDSSSVNPVVQPPPPSNPDPQPTTSVPQFLQSSDSVASLPQARSYLQTNARVRTSEPGSPLPSVSSIETVVSEASTPETATPQVSESVVLLQPPRNHSVAPSTRPNHQNTNLPTPLDQRPLRSLTPPGNTVHIGTIDIHITPPPTPALQPAATAPKPAALSSLSRGFTSSFGLRQG
jgi:hypothetical protein